MAKVTITVSNSDGSVSYESPTLTDANMARLIDYAWQKFQPVDVNGDPLPRIPANEVTAIRSWGRAKFMGFAREVVENEKVRAAIAAKDAIGDLEG